MNAADEESKNGYYVLMSLSLCVLFIRYNMATFLSSFFPNYAEDVNITSTSSGAIFSAYPIGMFLTSLVATRMIIKMGLKNSILLGMLLNAMSILLMGLVPVLFGENACKIHSDGSLECLGLQIGFFVFYFLSGLLGALAECACFVALQNFNKERRAAMVAAGSMACGIGCMVGPELGGLVYDLGNHRIYLPFLVFSVVPALLCVPIAIYFPSLQKIDPDKPTGNMSDVLTWSFALSWIGYALNGTIVATLDPTLETKLDDPPFNSSSTVVGLVFMASSIIYTLVTYPVGYFSDTRWKGRSRVLKFVLAISMFSLFVCFALLGPFRLGPSLDLKSLDSWFSVSVAMAFKGLGSALGAVAYADLIIGIAQDDEILQATVVSLNNAAYAVGWGVGPLIGGGLLQICDFSGYCTVIAIASLSYGVLLVVAPLFGVVSKDAILKDSADDGTHYKPLNGGDDSKEENTDNIIIA